MKLSSKNYLNATNSKPVRAKTIAYHLFLQGLMAIYCSLSTPQTINPKLYAVLDGHTDKITSISFSPDGANLLTSSLDHTAVLWDVFQGKLLHTFQGHQQGITAASFSNDGITILTGGGDLEVKVWDAQQWTPIKSLENEAFQDLTAFSSDGKFILTGGIHGLKLWDCENGTVKLTYYDEASAIYQVGFSPDAQYIYYTMISRFGYTKIVETLTNEYKYSFSYGLVSGFSASAPPSGFDFSPDSIYVITDHGSTVGYVEIYSIENGLIHSFVIPVECVGAAAISPAATYFVTAGNCNESSVQLWDGETGELLSLLSTPPKSPTLLLFSPDGTFLALAEGKTAYLWSMEGLSRQSTAPSWEVYP